MMFVRSVGPGSLRPWPPGSTALIARPSGAFVKELHTGRFRIANPLMRSAVWTIPPPNPANAPPGFPLELARRCIAMGWGRVLHSQAGTGTAAPPAEEQGKSWTLFDGTDAYRDAFEQRLAGKGEPDPPSRFSVPRKPR